MRESTPLLQLAAGGLTAFAVVAAIIMSSVTVRAGEEARSNARPPATCTCPGTSSRPQRPKFAELKSAPVEEPTLDATDHMAALSSIHQALSATADGGSYVWHRSNGRVSGLIRPTSSFKNVEGSICRHLIVMLTTGQKTRKTEGIACRGAGGVWSLEG
jgi:surface antigen